MGTFEDIIPKLTSRSTHLTITATLVGAVLALGVIRAAKSLCRRHELKSKVKRRLQQQEKQFDRIRQLTADVPDDFVKEILSKSVDEIIDGIRAGEWGCLRILRAFQKAALRAQEKTNCIVEFLEEAEKRAEALDAAGSDPEYKKPPLFGLPISIKACVSIQGHDQFCGYADNLEKPADEDALVIQQLRELGAIPFVTTTVPLSMLTFSCENPVYGTTSHPERTDRTCGGSSGGEGALIGAKGSIIGIGGDVGGSIRIPAAFCGIAGLKPSHRRFSQLGCPGSVPGRSHTFASIGPMATTIKNCTRLLQAMWSENNWHHEHDPYVPPFSFNSEVYLSKKPLKIGFYIDDGWFKATPAVERAVLETVEVLRGQGHTVVEFKLPDIYRAIQLVYKATTFDNGKYLHDAIGDDLPVDGYGAMVRQSSLPTCLRKAVSSLLANASPRLANLAGACHSDLTDLRLTNCGVEEYRKEFQKRWRNAGLDCILCPINVCPAMRHKEPYKLFASVSYTILYNALDYAGGTVPVTRVTQEDCDKLKDYPTTDIWYKAAKKAATDTVGLPVGIQIVVPPYSEECALRVLGEIEENVKKNGKFTSN